MLHEVPPRPPCLWVSSLDLHLTKTVECRVGYGRLAVLEACQTRLRLQVSNEAGCIGVIVVVIVLFILVVVYSPEPNRGRHRHRVCTPLHSRQLVALITEQEMHFNFLRL